MTKGNSKILDEAYHQKTREDFLIYSGSHMCNMTTARTVKYNNTMGTTRVSTNKQYVQQHLDPDNSAMPKFTHILTFNRGPIIYKDEQSNDLLKKNFQKVFDIDHI